MRYCPKCEKIYEDDDEVCMPCGVELVARLKRRESMDEVEEDYARSLFDDDRHLMKFCASCLREFMPKSRACIECGELPVVTAPREFFEARLKRSQVLTFLEEETAQREIEAELVRVLEAPTPSLAAFAAASLEGMGVDAFMGNDEMEPNPAQPGVGIFVPADEEEACSMIIPDDLDDWFEEEEEFESETRSRYQRKLSLATGYKNIGRLVYAMALAAEATEMEPDAPDAFHLLGMITAERGDHQRAVECFRAAIERQAAPMRQTSAWPFVGHSLLDAAGQPSLKGPAADQALEFLTAFCSARPRFLPAWLLQLELLDARDAKTRAEAVVAQIRQVNRFILDLDGPAKQTIQRWHL